MRTQPNPCCSALVSGGLFWLVLAVLALDVLAADSMTQHGQPAAADRQVIPAVGLQAAEQPPVEAGESSREPRPVPVRIDAHPRDLLEGRSCAVHLKPVEIDYWSRRFTTYEGKVLTATDDTLKLEAHTHRVSYVSTPSLITHIPFLAQLFKNTGVGHEPIDEALSIPLDSISSIEVLPHSRPQPGQ